MEAALIKRQSVQLWKRNVRRKMTSIAELNEALLVILVILSTISLVSVSPEKVRLRSGLAEIIRKLEQSTSSSVTETAASINFGLPIADDDNDSPDDKPTTPYRVRDAQHQAWINSGKYQGDIAGMNPKYAFASNTYRNAVKDRSLKWTNGIVPYHIAPVFGSTELQVIQGALQTYHKKTCIQFIPWTNERDYLYIYKDYGCYSLVGRVGGRQELSLGRGCLFHEIIVHEIMHTLGFWHEQSRADRDSNIIIRWENILPGMKSQFDKVDFAYSDFLSERYDYYSVMHYDSTAFSRNGQNTIETVEPGMTQVIGTAMDLSEGDLRRINTLYECYGRIGVGNMAGTSTATSPWQPSPLITTPPEKECSDTFLDCPFFFRYCYRQSFLNVMQQYCGKTCNQCQSKKFNRDNLGITFRRSLHRQSYGSSRFNGGGSDIYHYVPVIEEQE